MLTKGFSLACPVQSSLILSLLSAFVFCFFILKGCLVLSHTVSICYVSPPLLWSCLGKPRLSINYTVTMNKWNEVMAWLWLVGRLCELCVCLLSAGSVVCVCVLLCCLAHLLGSVCFKGHFDILSFSPLFFPLASNMSQYRVKGWWICSSATLNTVWDWTDNAICTDRDPHPFCDSCLVKKAPCKCQAKIPAEQMSRWPSGFMWFCLLYVEVLFCCMRRSAVSLGCSEPGWERWREGTTPTHRLYPEWGIGTFFRT